MRVWTQLRGWCVVLVIGIMTPWAGGSVASGSLESAVRSLPGRSPAERVKRAMLEVALERAASSRAAGLTHEADRLVADVTAALGTRASDMCRRFSHDDKRVPALKAVVVTRGNPYLDALVGWGKRELAVAEPAWPRATRKQQVIRGLDARKVGEEMRNWLWLFANPASPLQSNPEVLQRLLRRCHAWMDAVLLHADPACTAKAEVYDQFAAESGLSALVEWITLHPGLLLPSQREEWDAGLRSAFDTLWPQMKRADNWNLNIETARMVAMLHLGQHFQRPDVVEKVLRHARATLARMRPDGGFPYNGDSNPSCNYHDVLIGSLAAIHDASGDPAIARGLAATQWKGPVMGRTDEFWTSPFHKTIRWNFARGTECGRQIVLTLSRNPYAHHLRGKPTGLDRDSIAWYRDDLPVAPMPDGYTIPDRNVDGPRGWYGRFNYAATLHRKSPGEQVTGGHETLMGAMTVDDPDGRVNSILVNVTPCVRVADQDQRDAKGVRSSAWARLAAGLEGTYLTGRHYSTAAADYALTKMRGSAYQGEITDWRGRQLWLGLPDRVIGMLSLVPARAGAREYEMQTVLRLISGGSAGAAACKKLTRLGPRQYRYGELDLLVHETNFPDLAEQVIPYRRSGFPATELALRVPRAAGGRPRTHALGAEYSCVIEVRPVWARGAAEVVTAREGPLLKLQVTVGEKRWQLIANPTAHAADLVLPALQQARVPACLRVSGVNGGLPTMDVPARLMLQPHQHAILIQSPDALDRQPGWESFEAMVRGKGNALAN